ncbi:DUF6477 family protein [Shimia sp. R9_3]|uniref:DUF6477 family protein n=1 Tax=Shimia sp. R9_3 TaxID=2821113 RepID=UPI001ADB2DFD|nr:DUF6477 family protein [Shimia sp. R9_3]MBO9400819.1 hypothetical protein [Shimia sp. R9_3]
MQDVLRRLSELRRPRLLIRAARAGCTEYVRDQHLRRSFGSGKHQRHSEALTRLIALESALNEARKTGAASYSLIEHVDLLIAMMGEAQLLQASRQN